ncbi:MAG: LD-carboxypeptidase [Clostridiales bacterium]|jgi:muramoyltetrapeptide carboxypeptidase|nr:LD-carboxypeptidase [Clostridiales bacterium]
MILPQFLHVGDKVALISPSGAQPPEKLEKALDSVRDFGLEPVAYPTCYLRHGYLAGTDKERAKDLTDAFLNPDTKAVISIRGGYGAHRLLEYVDFDEIASTGKALYGYSDITALHMELNRRGLISWHTPMPGTEWYQGLDDFTKESVKFALFGSLPSKIVNPDGSRLKTLIAGSAEGELIGGNLSLVASTLGTYYEIEVKDKILFLEDVDELPYKIDRMLLQLRHGGKLDNCAGIIFGEFSNCEAEEPSKSITVNDIIEELVGDIGKPVVSGLHCGHVLPTACLPLGARVLLNADEGIINIQGE